MSGISTSVVRNNGITSQFRFCFSIKKAKLCKVLKQKTVGGRYINFFTDFGFKKLFGTEVNKDLLIDFLMCIYLLIYLCYLCFQTMVYG